jgi:hypothetical protein
VKVLHYISRSLVLATIAWSFAASAPIQAQEAPAGHRDNARLVVTRNNFKPPTEQRNLTRNNRRNFIGTAVAAVGGFSALQKVAGADRSRSDPGPANAMLDDQNPDSMWPLTRRAWSKTSSIRSPLQTSVFTKADGHVK